MLITIHMLKLNPIMYAERTEDSALSGLVCVVDGKPALTAKGKQYNWHLGEAPKPAPLPEPKVRAEYPYVLKDVGGVLTHVRKDGKPVKDAKAKPTKGK